MITKYKFLGLVFVMALFAISFMPHLQAASSLRRVTPQNWEPWVDSAAVGDMVMRKTSGFNPFQPNERLEVVTIHKDYVIVKINNWTGKSSNPKFKGKSQSKKYSRHPHADLRAFYKTKTTSKPGQTTFKGKRFNYKVSQQRIPTGFRSGVNTFKVTHFQTKQYWVAPGIPFGGILKSFHILESNATNRRVPDRRKTGAKTLELDYDVVDFKLGKKAPKESSAKSKESQNGQKK